MKLTIEGIKDRAAWEKAGIALPGYDVEKISEKAKEEPGWVHFGIGNIFRIFIGGIQAVVRGVDRNITGANVQLRALKALAAVRDINRGAVRAVRTDVQHQVAVNGVIRGIDGQRAALDSFTAP